MVSSPITPAHLGHILTLPYPFSSLSGSECQWGFQHNFLEAVRVMSSKENPQKQKETCITNILVTYFCCNKLPQTPCFRTMHMCHTIVLEHRRLTQVLLDQNHGILFSRGFNPFPCLFQLPWPMTLFLRFQSHWRWLTSLPYRITLTFLHGHIFLRLLFCLPLPQWRILWFYQATGTIQTDLSISKSLT